MVASHEDPSPGVGRQLKQSLVGEVAGTIVSVGAVYLARHVAPDQADKLTGLFARLLTQHRGDSPEHAGEVAHKITDVALMHIGGLGNMAAQMVMRLRSPEVRAEFGLKELGRVIVGRIAGTTTALSTIASAERYASPSLRSTENVMAGGIHAARSVFQKDRVPGAEDTRLASLILSSLVQSAGAIVGNAPSQLLYDKVVGPGKSRG